METSSALKLSLFIMAAVNMMAPFRTQRKMGTSSESRKSAFTLSASLSMASSISALEMNGLKYLSCNLIFLSMGCL